MPRLTSRLRRRLIAAVFAAALIIGPARAWGQTATPTPTPTPTPEPAAPPQPRFTPTIAVSGSLFADYTYTAAPRVIAEDGSTFAANSFNITRGYFTIIAGVSPRLSVRLTADAARQTGEGTSFNGSLALRIKYAYMQLDTDRWLGPGSWIKFGVQQTPFIEAVETVYRYRFQGTLFTERDAQMSSSDAGFTARIAFPGAHGDMHGGIFNGDGYRSLEANDQKSLQLRATYRPAPRSNAIGGLSVQAFINDDHYTHGAPKRRALVSAYFQHRRFHAGIDFLDALDQVTLIATRTEGHGYSFFVTPFFHEKGKGPEALFRFDWFRPNLDSITVRHRVIAGLAYWLPHESTRPIAIMVDFENLTVVHPTAPVPVSRKFGVHGVVSF